MFTSVVAALALAASVSQVAASPINHVARNYAKDAELLEDYTPYHVRYIALNCQGQHNSAFFEQCCHPLLKWQKLSDRPAQCIPSPSASSSAALAEPSAPVVDEEPLPETCDDDEDDDECTEESTSTSYGQATSSLIATYAPEPTKSAEPITSKYDAPPTTSSPAPETTKKAKAAAPVTTSTEPAYSAPEPTTTHKPTSTKEAASAAPTSSAAPSTGGGDVISGGFATFFYQKGIAGACGDVHPDSDYIVAADYRRYGDLSKQSSLCGKQVRITNTKNGKSVTATVADACPTCTNENCLDLSEGAFTQIATKDDGEVPIEWSFI